MNLKIKFELEETELNGEIENLIPSSSGGSLPSGGTTGQVLTKNSNADGDAGWKDSSGGSYTLPVASSTTLGGVKIGSGITVGDDGTISASGGDGEWNLVLDTVINDNPVYQPLTLDYETGVMTFNEELPTKDIFMPKGLAPNLQAGDTVIDAWKYIPNEFLTIGALNNNGIYNGKTTIVSGGVNQYVDPSRFHFEQIASIAHTWNGLNCNKLKFELLAPNIMVWAFNANIEFHILLSDGTSVKFSDAYDTNGVHAGLFAITMECCISHEALWISTAKKKYVLKSRSKAATDGTFNNQVDCVNTGKKVAQGVTIAGIATTKRNNQQSGMYNGTIIRIWEG